MTELWYYLDTVLVGGSNPLMASEITQLQIGDNGRTEVVVEEGRCTLRKSLYLEGEQKGIVDIFKQECEVISQLNHPRFPKLLKHETRDNHLQLLWRVVRGPAYIILLSSFQVC